MSPIINYDLPDFFLIKLQMVGNNRHGELIANIKKKTKTLGQAESY